MTTSAPKSTASGSTRENRLIRYCAAGAGAAALAGTITTADASVTFINYGGQVVNDPAPGDGYYGLIPFDLNRDGTFDLNLGVGQGESFGAAAAIFGPTTGTVGITGFYSSGFSYAAKLAAGATI